MGGTQINSCDKKFILGIQKKYGKVKINDLELTGLLDRYIFRHSKFKHIRLLNYIDYDFEKAKKDLEKFCGFKYYGGKHYESVLTRFMQCNYLPEKFGVDKRKSHYSSLIMSGNLKRDDAISLLQKPLYEDRKLLESDKKYLADYMGISMVDFDNYFSQPPKKMSSYKHSYLNELAPIARKFRRFIE